MLIGGETPRYFGLQGREADYKLTAMPGREGPHSGQPEPGLVQYSVPSKLLKNDKIDISITSTCSELTAIHVRVSMVLHCVYISS